MARKSTFDRQCQWLYNFLQRPSSVVAWAYHWTVAIVILLGLLFFALATVTELPELHKRSELALKILEIAILAILTLEFLLLVWASSCTSRYRGCLGKLRYILMSFRQLDLVIIGATAVVVWTCYLPSEQSHLLFLRCGMLFQILRLENRFQAWRFLRTVLRIERPHILASALPVYSGDTSKVDQFAGELFELPNKYDFQPLAQASIETITMDNVAQLYYLTNLHQQEELKKRMMYFIGKNKKAVVKTDGWRQFVEPHAKLLNQLIVHL